MGMVPESLTTNTRKPNVGNAKQMLEEPRFVLSVRCQRELADVQTFVLLCESEGRSLDCVFQCRHRSSTCWCRAFSLDDNSEVAHSRNTEIERSIQNIIRGQ